MTVPSDATPRTPLELILVLMQEKWVAGHKDAAANLAKLAAPYVHPRARPEPPDKAASDMSDEELGLWMGDDDEPPPYDPTD